MKGHKANNYYATNKITRENNLYTTNKIAKTVYQLKFPLCWPRLNIFVEAPQAQVSRVNIYLQSVGQDFTCLMKPHRHR